MQAVPRPGHPDEPWRAFDSTEFRGRVALVTGAASGMGAATARAFVARGAHVVLADIDETELKRVENTLRNSPSTETGPNQTENTLRNSPSTETSESGNSTSGPPTGGNSTSGPPASTTGEPSASATPASAHPRTLGARTDVADEESVTHLFELIDETYGRLDHVVHAAATLTATPFLQSSASHWRRVLDINLVGTANVLRPALVRMLENGTGTAVALASDAGHRGAGHDIADGAYAASKSGVLALVKSLAREFAGQGVRINAIAPGASDTPLLSDLSDEKRQWIESMAPLGRLGRPEEIAAAALFLSSRAAGFVYGATLDVDGGSMFR